jgi:hypothetical protein
MIQRSTGAQSKDPEEANTSHTFNTFSSTKARAQVSEVEKVREAEAGYSASGSFDCAPIEHRVTP